jgi:hypothetical protein
MTSFSYYAPSSLKILTDRVDTFKWVNVVFPTTFKVVTTTLQLKNTLYTTPFPWNQKFTSYFLQLSHKHLVHDQSPQCFQILCWLGWHFEMIECGAKDLQIEWDWIQYKGMHPSTMIRWSQAMLTSVLLQRSHESGQPS